MFIKRASLILIIAAIATGCASYRAMPLSTVNSPEALYWQQGQEVVIAAKAFNRHDCKKYLDRNVLKEGYVPVQLTIQNRSDKNYLFSLARVSLPTACADEVADTVHTSTEGRVIGYTTAGLFFWPFFIPAIVDGVKSARANDALDKDFDYKTAKDQVIAPHSYVNMLLFIPRQCYHPSFNVTLVDMQSNQPYSLAVRAIR